MPAKRVLKVLALLVVFTCAAAAEAAERPRIGLVLSGGGARGAAHVGVLKVLEEMRVPIDAIAGTSMGAVVGGLYASGLSAAQIEELMSSVNWQDAFRDRPPRAELNYRRKQDDRNFLVRYALGVRRDGFVLPRGLVQGQKLEQLLRSATLPVMDVEDFDDLPIPFRAIATDLETGEPVVMSRGDLVVAMRASMSAPPVFAPTPYDGRLLIDGGLVENLPVETAQQMGVDILIAVDVSFPLYARDQLVSPIEVTNQAFAIMIRGRTLEQRRKLGPADVLIEPPLGRLTAVDFARVPQALEAGEEGAYAVSAQLATLSLDQTAYDAYLARREARAVERSPLIEFVRVDAASSEYERLVTAKMRDLIDMPLDEEVIGRKLSELYALDLFESIDYRLVTEEGRSGLELHLRRKSWGPNYIRVGLNLEDDFEGNSRYNAALRFISTEINDLGGEWLTDLQIGDNPRLFSEFYQPLSLSHRYFVAPKLEFEEHSVFLREEEDRIAEYRVREYEAGLDIGREISDWGEVRLGIRRGSGRSSVLIGDPSLPSDTFERGGLFARLSYDKLDSIFFPRRGQQFEFEWRGERSDLGANQNFDTFAATWLIARSIERHTFIFWTDVGTTIDDLATPENFFTLGGFWNLSGLPPRFLGGPHYGIGRLIYYKQIGRGGPRVLDFPAYIGLSLEAGNTWMDRDDAGLGDLRKNGSLFFGVDSPLGPVYLGAGFDEDGGRAFYLFLGRTF